MPGDEQPRYVRRPWHHLAVTSLLGLTVLVLAATLVGVLAQRHFAAKLDGDGKSTAPSLTGQNQKLRDQLYAAHMNLARRTWEEANVGMTRSLLEQYRPQPGQKDLRRFEWHYLNRLC